jgi:TRAP-type transport system periplasmic protein
MPHVARAQRAIRMRLAHAANEVHPGHIATVRFKEALEKLLPGRVNIQIFSNRQLGDDKQSLESAIAGTVELAGTSGIQIPDPACHRTSGVRGLSASVPDPRL